MKVKDDVNLKDPSQRLRDAPRCTAMAKSMGKRCRNPSKQGWTVCRLHGAGGGAPPGKAHPNYKYGLRSKAFTEQRKRINQLIRDLNNFD